MLESLEWLLPPPADFRQQIKDLRAAIEAGELAGVEARLQALANHGLGLTQLEQLAKTTQSYAAAAAKTDLRRVKLGLLGAGTLDVIAPALVATGLRHNLLLEVVLADYGTTLQAACDPDSEFRAADPEFVLVSSDYRTLDLDSSFLSEDEAQAKVEFAAQTLRATLEGLKTWVKGGILFQTVVPPMEPLFGSLDFAQSQSCYAMVGTLNRTLGDWARAGELTLVDIARAATWVGLERWHDPTRWHLAKMPFAMPFVPLYADLVGRVLAAITGKARKCLVLDLDNTLCTQNSNAASGADAVRALPPAGGADDR